VLRIRQHQRPFLPASPGHGGEAEDDQNAHNEHELSIPRAAERQFGPELMVLCTCPKGQLH
jgi:hypothetical protein